MQPRSGPRVPPDANLILLLLIAVSVVALIVSRARQAVETAPGSGAALEPAGQPLYFETGGYVFGFSRGQISLSTPDQVLLVEFIGSSQCAPHVINNGIPPTPSAQYRDSTGVVQPLGQVGYRDLWPGITLTCSGGPGGYARGSYTLAPGADPGLIRVHYSAPVTIEPDGLLKLHLPGGTLAEAPPQAWQDFEGQRMYVPVSYVVALTRAGQEVRLNLESYDPRYPVTIAPVLMPVEE